jgi:hypothetical protein
VSCWQLCQLGTVRYHTQKEDSDMDIKDRAGRANREYRKLRSMGWKPPSAVEFIRKDEKLSTAEMYGEITFNRVFDNDYQAERADGPDSTDPEYTKWYDEEVEKLNSGEWVAYGIVATAKVAAQCRTCRQDAPTREDSLWGIVVDNSTGDLYLRSVEIELAHELDVI